MNISDKVVNIGTKNYVEATVKVWDITTGSTWETTAYAREAESKKGMDDSQITGSTSSYARKYALNGMFLIDDTKDADGMDNSEKGNTDKYTDMTISLEDCLNMDALKTAWRNVWTGLEGDGYGREHMTTVYNKCKQELSK